MKVLQLGALEFKFAEIIWREEPVSSAALCQLASEELNWHKSTTYTVLRRLCEKGVFKNEKSIVSSVLTRKEYFSIRSANIVDEEFDGSLPAFIAAFTNHKQLTDDELSALRGIVAKHERKE